MSATMRIDVDLFSDTVTRPTPAMRRFMCDAEVGDEQKGEDPTVNHLQEMVAALLGKEAAVVLPSGTMFNEIAMRVHCRPGDEMLTDGASSLRDRQAISAGQRQRAPLDGVRGQFDAAAVHGACVLPADTPPGRLLGRADRQSRRRRHRPRSGSACGRSGAGYGLTAHGRRPPRERGWHGVRPRVRRSLRLGVGRLRRGSALRRRGLASRDHRRATAGARRWSAMRQAGASSRRAASARSRITSRRLADDPPTPGWRGGRGCGISSIRGPTNRLLRRDRAHRCADRGRRLLAQRREGPAPSRRHAPRVDSPGIDRALGRPPVFHLSEESPSPAWRPARSWRST